LDHGLGLVCYARCGLLPAIFQVPITVNSIPESTDVGSYLMQLMIPPTVLAAGSSRLGQPVQHYNRCVTHSLSMRLIKTVDMLLCSSMLTDRSDIDTNQAWLLAVLLCRAHKLVAAISGFLSLSTAADCVLCRYGGYGLDAELSGVSVAFNHCCCC
jgi:hypothetical protein